MREVRITVPQGRGADVAQLILGTGASEATVYPVYVHGPNRPKEVVSVETSTPQAKAIIDTVMPAPFFNPREYTISSDELRAVVSQDPPRKVTQPMIETAGDAFEELWQRGHITVSLAGRAFVAGLLLSFGMRQGSLLPIIAALLFTPFLPQVLATSFGIRAKEWGLAKQGAMALTLNTLLTVAAGAIVALLAGGSLQFSQFNSPLTNFLISLAIGIVAGLATADDVGRRELIGLAAAAQYAIFPAWFGISLVLGFPDATTTLTRIASFAINVGTIVGVGVATYSLLGMKGDEVRRFAEITGQPEEQPRRAA